MALYITEKEIETKLEEGDFILLKKGERNGKSVMFEISFQRGQDFLFMKNDELGKLCKLFLPGRNDENILFYITFIFLPKDYCAEKIHEGKYKVTKIPKK